MKYTHLELSSLKDGSVVIDEDLSLSAEQFNLPLRLRKLSDVVVEGQGQFDREHQLFYVSGVVSGLMIVPCAITLEDIEYPFESPFNAVYSFDPTEDEGVLLAVDDTVDVMDVVFDEILSEIPLKVVKEGLSEYPRGEGWEVVREDEYEAAKKQEPDPRLVKLKEFIDK